MNHLRGARRYFLPILTAVLALSGCSSRTAPREVPDRPSGSPSATTRPSGSGLNKPKKIADADSPTSLAVDADGKLYFTELEGRLKILEPDGKTHTVAEFNVSTDGERGLLGLALHPKFPNPPYAYVFLSPGSNDSISEVRRFEIRDGRAGEMRTILKLPAGDDCCHKGGRVTFGPDEKLYVSVGDNQIPKASQDRNDLRGKILRYNDDGSVPADGPFGENPVWAIGLRNPFGMRFAPDGSLWVTDNGPSGNDGPSCCDELNKIERGGNYGWPDRYGPNDSSSLWLSGKEPAVPTGVAVIAEGVAFCTYAWERMLIYRDGSITNGPEQCMLDVTQGNDGVYFSSSTAIFKA